EPCTQNAFFVSVLLLCFSYTLEVLQRKDFIQATMVFRESRRSEQLLLNILPEKIVAKLKESYSSTSASYEDVSILFAHVAHFAEFAMEVEPQDLVDFLNMMFGQFDRIVEKIKTIGDGYMAACGLPDPNPLHAKAVARAAIGMIKLSTLGFFRHPGATAYQEQPSKRQSSEIPSSGETECGGFSALTLSCGSSSSTSSCGTSSRTPSTSAGKEGNHIALRIGIHSGPCVAGVIGEKKFAFDVWGDAVNVASRMESSGEDGKIHCSQAMRDLLYDDFECVPRGRMYVKGKGEMNTFFV
ncbi:unnamed protein product, partial [Amoebophrya sp. A25]